MDNNYGVISTTIDCIDRAKEISDKIIKYELGKCIQISQIKSIYKWKSKINDEKEYKIEIKLKNDPSLKSKIVNIIKENHTYENPEIIFIPIEILSQEYEIWLNDES